MKLILLLSIFFLSFNSFSSSYKAKGSLPFELEAMIESLPWNIYNLKQKEKINLLVRELDGKLSAINEKERFLFAKSSLIRFFLNNPPSNSFSETVFRRDILREIRNSFGKEKQTQFVHWFMRALVSDLEDTFNSPEYVNLQGKDPKSNSILRKKFQLIGPWINFFKGKNKEEINFALSELYIRAIEHLNSKIESYVNFKTMKKNFISPSKNLAFFKIEKETKIPEIENNMLSIIDEVIKRHEKAGIPAPIEDWVPNDDDLAKKETPLVVPTPNPDYVAPDKLPEPVDDWLFEI
tara:strand:+ start:188058 stop:188939 length:882 start_codon:yes stop_codon:yes gene_type:complete